MQGREYITQEDGQDGDIRAGTPSTPGGKDPILDAAARRVIIGSFFLRDLCARSYRASPTDHQSRLFAAENRQSAAFFPSPPRLSTLENRLPSRERDGACEQKVSGARQPRHLRAPRRRRSR